jgi:hypothetical protein
MSDSQRLIPWLALTLLTVVGIAGAVLGLTGAPKQAGLDAAVHNTLSAPNYTSLLQATGQTPQTQSLTWESPNKLGGWVDTGGRRFYVYVLGSTEYQSSAVAVTTKDSDLTYLRGTSQPAASYDPVQGYLPYAERATHVTQHGNSYSFPVTQEGQTAEFTVTVSGQYVSQLKLVATGTAVDLSIGSVGTAPPVTLPSGAKIKAASTSSSASSSAG